MQRSIWPLVALLLVGVAGCKPDTPAPPKAAAPPPVAQSRVPVPAPPPDPCTLVSHASVARLVAGAQPGVRDRTEESYGTYTCHWSGGSEPVVLQVFTAGPGGVAHELRAASLEIVDVKRSDAGTLVRMEPFKGIADGAGAFVERADAKRGIRRSYAIVMVQRGDRLVSLRMPSLASGDRADALDSLRTLADEIAQKLP